MYTVASLCTCICRSCVVGGTGISPPEIHVGWFPPLVVEDKPTKVSCMYDMILLSAHALLCTCRGAQGSVSCRYPRHWSAPPRGVQRGAGAHVRQQANSPALQRSSHKASRKV
jgi:hypothetical protein